MQTQDAPKITCLTAPYKEKEIVDIDYDGRGKKHCFLVTAITPIKSNRLSEREALELNQQTQNFDWLTLIADTPSLYAVTVSNTEKECHLIYAFLEGTHHTQVSEIISKTASWLLHKDE